MNDATLETVARNVRAARTGAGLSLDALAERADVSKGAAVALEGARGNPNLTTLVRVADALGLPVTALMQERRHEPVTLVDAEGVTPLWTGPAGGTAKLLLTTPRPSPVEVWRWQLHPGERFDSRAHQPGVSETLTVVRGRLTLDVDGEVHGLRAGQTIAFPADVPHAYEGAGRGPCALVMTVHLPKEQHRA
jgi:quercetin dioxygenase-like cupin family protein/DNA-binding XRE family transcriptional regulator